MCYFWNIWKLISNEVCSFGNNEAFHADLSLVAISQREHRRQVEWRFFWAIKSCSAPNIICLFTLQYFHVAFNYSADVSLWFKLVYIKPPNGYPTIRSLFRIKPALVRKPRKTLNLHHEPTSQSLTTTS